MSVSWGRSDVDDRRLTVQGDRGTIEADYRSVTVQSGAVTRCERVPGDGLRASYAAVYASLAADTATVPATANANDAGRLTRLTNMVGG